MEPDLAQYIQLLFFRPNLIKAVIKEFASQELYEDICRIKQKFLAKRLVKHKLDIETKLRLLKIFREDILKLQDLTKIDFSGWLQ